ncbi:MAG: HAMP domain-containing histidine kinase [Polyangiaceae bacterium]|nr:HAMP domain-containing histidine kinase [Polyangiaceae bacterium]
MIVDEIFVDRVAHDLRGELSTMLAGVHYMLRFGRDAAVPPRDMLERVGDAGERLTRLIEEFDDSVWLLDKPKPLLPAPTRLQELLDDVVTRSTKLAALRGVRPNVEIMDGGDREFTADADMLARALLYVLDFAMLRAPSPSVRVSATFDDGVPVVRIFDEGPTIPDPVKERLFEPFVENELASLLPQGKRKVRLGLGLAISRAIFEEHGGSLAVESPADANSSGIVLRCVLTR